MEKWLKNILALQETDLKIRNLNLKLGMIPAEVKTLMEDLKAEKQLIKDCKEKQQEIELNLKKIEANIADENKAIDELNEQSKEIKKTEEYNAFSNEVKNHQDNIGEFETEELIAWEELDEAKGNLKKAQNDGKQTEKRIKLEAEELKELQLDLTSQIKLLTDKRNSQKENVGRKELSLYERLLSKGKGEPVSLVTHDSCGNCRLKLLQQTVTQATNYELTKCENCGHILYLP